ncbi:Protein N-acetyltransferase, RimJ/RimL family [Salegentibacter salinarum]|uniref:GNAT family N-acetyltransferase n=1 Tax=Salegentibacter salinarum TaxID=447422 RepID=UPI0009A67384|nr:GNAT family N-acetyltransferase [Salegentibacter salinarum]SKB59646.1 Protein N-acetyltransferase, RimJ/RimL family [Salegentibacter salinarum]
MSVYKILDQQVFSSGEYSIVPIRMEDRYDIMKWRNEQMYHLRQNEPLTKEKQDIYFESVISNLFELDKPSQILFSYLKDEECIGYGGLVHIKWTDKNAEISFIMNTSLEKEYFEFHWVNYLKLLEKVAFNEINLHKIYTYAFDLRPRLYNALGQAGFGFELDLKEHCFFQQKYIDVKIHSKFNKKNELRHVEISDFYLTYSWANNQKVREFSFNKDKITLKEHANWFFSKLENTNFEYYLLEVQGVAAGSIRFDLEKESIAKINYLLDPKFTGKGLGTYLLENGIQFLIENRPLVQVVYGYVLKENIPSIKIFKKLSFKEISKNASELKFEKFI